MEIPLAYQTTNTMHAPILFTKKRLLDFSKRERQILQLIAKGMTTREIALELSISENTVESHRKRMIRRVEARNIFGVFHYTISNGILQPSVFSDPYLL